MTPIAHLMTPEPVTIRSIALVAEASRLMVTRGLRHLPVVDDEGRLVGIVSDRDLRGPLIGDDRPTRPSRPAPTASIGGLMTRDVQTARPEESLGAVARRIVDRRVGAMPIVDESGRLVGIVSYMDVLRRLAEDAEHDARAIELMDVG